MVATDEDSDTNDVLDVKGGLVIPLYVVVLSVIGGAINMTRKVPRFQREGEYSEMSLPSPVGRLESRVISAASSLAMIKTTKGDQGVATAAIPPSGEPSPDLSDHRTPDSIQFQHETLPVEKEREKGVDGTHANPQAEIKGEDVEESPAKRQLRSMKRSITSLNPNWSATAIPIIL